jgi:hypothetical protein
MTYNHDFDFKILKKKKNAPASFIIAQNIAGQFIHYKYILRCIYNIAGYQIAFCTSLRNGKKCEVHREFLISFKSHAKLNLIDPVT